MNNKTINAQELIDFITKHKSAIFNEYDCYKDHTQSKIKWNMRNEDMFNKLITVINGMAKDETEIEHEQTEEIVHCIDCKYLMFSDCYGECSKAYKDIVKPDDYCEYGVRKVKENGK